MGTHQQHITSIHQLQAQRHREILASAVAGPKSMHCLSVRRVVHLLVLAKEWIPIKSLAPINVSSHNRGVSLYFKPNNADTTSSQHHLWLLVGPSLPAFIHPHSAFCSSATRTQPFVELTHLVDLKYLKYSMISDTCWPCFFSRFWYLESPTPIDFRTCWPFFSPNSGIWNPPNPASHQTQHRQGWSWSCWSRPGAIPPRTSLFSRSWWPNPTAAGLFLRGSVVGCCWDIHPAYPNPMHKWIHIYIYI